MTIIISKHHQIWYQIKVGYNDIVFLIRQFPCRIETTSRQGCQSIRLTQIWKPSANRHPKKKVELQLSLKRPDHLWWFQWWPQRNVGLFSGRPVALAACLFSLVSPVPLWTWMWFFLKKKVARDCDWSRHPHFFFWQTHKLHTSFYTEENKVGQPAIHSKRQQIWVKIWRKSLLHLY